MGAQPARHAQADRVAQKKNARHAQKLSPKFKAETSRIRDQVKVGETLPKRYGSEWLNVGWRVRRRTFNVATTKSLMLVEKQGREFPSKQSFLFFKETLLQS